ncbi:MAG TPA: BatD family protein [Kofleriaceae bacterium]|nr:BatD family protein [Kofleriaceae bacterium]
MRVRSILTMVVAAVLLSAGAARAQQASLHVDREAYAELPFTLSLAVEGFEQSPEPAQPDLEIAGCQVQKVGVEPRMATSISIVNGRRTQRVTVTFVMTYRITATRPGTYQIPALSVQQGNLRARTEAGTIRVGEIQTTPDMALELVLPERPVWTGETVPVYLDWYLRKDPGDQQFAVPLFEMADTVRIQPPAASGPSSTDMMNFWTGAGQMQLPYAQSRELRDGVELTRVRFTAEMTPIKAGTIEVPASRAVAKIKMGVGRDRMGFPAARYELYKAVDRARTLQIKPLPLEGRPPSFANAVGTSFSIAVRASRSVVRLGEPVDLEVTIRGDARLDGLILPPLDAPGALDPRAFATPEEAPVGQLEPGDGHTKTFKVTIQLKDAAVTTIPRLPFSFFDPVAGEYRTVESEAIAMQVEGVAIVGAGDVVSGQRGRAASPDREPGGGVSARGADLGLSHPNDTMRSVLSVSGARPFLWLLYLLPLVVLVGRVTWVRRRARRDHRAEARAASSALEAAVRAAGANPAREGAGPLVNAIRALARAHGRPDADAAPIVERIETEAFAPEAADSPLAEVTLADVLALARDWAASADRDAAPPPAGTSAALVLVAMALGSTAHAGQTDVGDRLQEARTAYDRAMSSTDRDTRTTGFARAAASFQSVVDAYPDRPELLTDWANAALGAGDGGRAVLGYRRALHLDPGLDRASRNLEFVRTQNPAWLPSPAGAGAVDTLFFWHRSMSPARRYLFGAIAFALAALLLAPWTDRRRALLQRLAIAPAVVWLALTGSALLRDDGRADAVVMQDAVVLRSADNGGAPAALASPLPSGAEIRIRARRDGWVNVALADGSTTGWLRDGAVTNVVPR